MNALQRPISLGYLASDPPYSTVAPHRGIDFAGCLGDPIIVGDTQIGLAGSTGRADGPHVHVQAGRGEWAQSTIDPAPYVGKPGIVVKVGEASEWGKYVCIKVDDVYVYYCHMSRQEVSIGKVIKQGGDMQNLTSGSVRYAFLLAYNHEPTQADIDGWTSGNNGDIEKLLGTLYGQNEWFRRDAVNYAGTYQALQAANARIAELESARPGSPTPEFEPVAQIYVKKEAR